MAFFKIKVGFRAGKIAKVHRYSNPVCPFGRILTVAGTGFNDYFVFPLNQSYEI